jgi:predicted TIM-barrel fold metal-dependent hydrolase
VYNYASQAPRRLFPTCCVPLHDVDLAIEELKRSKNMGHVGANIPCVPPPDKPYSDPSYDKFW